LLATIFVVSGQEPAPLDRKHLGYKAIIMGRTYENVVALHLFSGSAEQADVDAELRSIYDLAGKALKEGEAFMVFPAKKGVLLLVEDTRVGDIEVRFGGYPGRNIVSQAGPPEAFFKRYVGKGSQATSPSK